MFVQNLNVYGFFTQYTVVFQQKFYQFLSKNNDENQLRNINEMFQNFRIIMKLYNAEFVMKRGVRACLRVISRVEK